MAWMFVVAVLTSACGGVNSPVVDAAVPVDALDAAVPPTKYRGTLAETSPPVMFGGPTCFYSMTLKQLEIKLAILTSGQPTSGTAQTLYVETVGTGCTGPPHAATIMNFAFASAAPSPTGMTLTFREDAGIDPRSSLVVELSTVNAAYQARMTFHRTDYGPPLDWIAVATASLTPELSSDRGATG